MPKCVQLNYLTLEVSNISAQQKSILSKKQCTLTAANMKVVFFFVKACL